MKKYFYILGIIGLSTLNTIAVQNAYPLKDHPYIIITKTENNNETIEYDYVDLKNAIIWTGKSDDKSLTEFVSQRDITCRYYVEGNEKTNETNTIVAHKVYHALKVAYEKGTIRDKKKSK